MRNQFIDDVCFCGLLIITITLGLALDQQTKKINEIRQAAKDSAEVCDSMVGMHLKDWQAAAGLPLTKRVNCDPLHKIANM